MQLYHDSQSTDCRTPIGPVPCDTQVKLRLYGAPRSSVVLLHLSMNDRDRLIPMLKGKNDCHEVVWTAPERPSVCFYYFSVLTRDGQTTWYGNAEDGLGCIGQVCSKKPEPFQITVYSPAYRTPDYLHKGVMYQIFPDRFYRTSIPETAKQDAYVHPNWSDEPLVRVDSAVGDPYCMDFFGGTLKGITDKLDYLQELGVTVLYLNPIFMARSNHRYDTADYDSIDPMLGSLQDFQELCSQARARGIRVLLDGVFSHTGDDSLYFNKYGHWDSLGACQSTQSDYYPWYKFSKYPTEYASWWGFKTLPELDKNNPDYQNFIYGEDGITRKWLRRGASGWRLDVADELSMPFLKGLRAAVKAEKADAALLGEVWEDASHKVSYGQMRCYCDGETLDSVMNYPLRRACIDFLLRKINALQLCRVIRSQQENYAPPFYYSLMNLMGSHDRARIFSVLGEALQRDDERIEGTQPELDEKGLALAKGRFLTFLKILVCLPGIPCIYYGDEVQMQGSADPYCRGTFPWGKEDAIFLNEVKSLLSNRQNPLFCTGHMVVWSEGEDTLVIRRFIEDGKDVFGDAAPNGDQTIRITR